MDYNKIFICIFIRSIFYKGNVFNNVLLIIFLGNNICIYLIKRDVYDYKIFLCCEDFFNKLFFL